MTPHPPYPWPDDTRYLRTGDLVLDLCYRRIDDDPTELPQRIFELLLLFLAEPARLHTRAELFARLWPGVIVEDANLSQSVWLLRRALGDARKGWVRTVAKGGYVFEAPGPVEALLDRPDPPANTDCAAPRDGTADEVGAARIDAGPATEQVPDVPVPRRRRLHWMAVVTAMLACVLITLGIQQRRVTPSPVSTTKPLSVALVLVEDHTHSAQWPGRLSYDWLRWKLSSLPEVTLLTEAELAAGTGATPPRVVFLAVAEAPDGAGKFVLRARLPNGGREDRIEHVGTPEQMPALADLLSRQILQVLSPVRAQPWPALRANTAAASLYVDQAEAMDRRDWIAASTLGERVVSLAPDFGLARLQLAQAKSHLSQAPDALEQMDAAMKLLQPAPQEVGELLAAQRLSMDPQQTEQATAAYQQLLQRHPRNLPLATITAGLLSRIGRPNDALAVLNSQDYGQAPIGARIASRTVYANIYEQLGDPAHVVQYAKEAERLATEAGPGWEIERAIALIPLASQESRKSPERTPSPLFEQAAALMERAGNPTGALYYRVLAETQAGPAPQPNRRLDKLLAQASAGGYRAVEFITLLYLARQQHAAGQIDKYHQRLEEAAGVALASGDRNSRNQIEHMLVNSDLLAARLHEAENRLQRLRADNLQGGFAIYVDLQQAVLNEIRGNSIARLSTLEGATKRLPQAAGQPPTELQSRLACTRTEVLLTLGDLRNARAMAKRCAQASTPELQIQLAYSRANIEWLAGDREAAATQLRQAQRLSGVRGVDEADRWVSDLSAAMLHTRLGQYAQSDQVVQGLPPIAQSPRYALVAALMETSLAENAAARGEWTRSRAHAARARGLVPGDAWLVTHRLDILDIVAAITEGRRGRAIALAAPLYQKALELRDVAVQIELRGLFDDGELTRQPPTQALSTLVARTGMRGATLDWLNIKPGPTQGN